MTYAYIINMKMSFQNIISNEKNENLTALHSGDEDETSTIMQPANFTIYNFEEWCSLNGVDYLVASTENSGGPLLQDTLDTSSSNNTTCNYAANENLNENPFPSSEVISHFIEGYQKGEISLKKELDLEKSSYSDDFTDLIIIKNKNVITDTSLSNITLGTTNENATHNRSIDTEILFNQPDGKKQLKSNDSLEKKIDAEENSCTDDFSNLLIVKTENVINNCDDSEVPSNNYSSKNVLKRKHSKSKLKVTTKTDIFLGEFNRGIFIETVQDGCYLKHFVKNADGENIVVPQNFQVTCTSSSREVLRQTVEKITLMSLGPGVDVKLPQFLTDCQGKIHFCPVEDCDTAFLQLTEARLHSLVHLGIKPFKCNFEGCSWAFYTIAKLQRHSDTHKQEKRFLCQYPDCNKAFTTIYNLNSHKKNHEKDADLQCSVPNCKEIFQTEKQRRLHYKAHSPTQAPFRCQLENCSRAFFTQSHLHFHEKLHQKRDFNCKWPNCGREFQTEYKLKAHMRIHTGAKPFVCHYESCKWSFSTASKLRRHLNIHSNERKFQCTINGCGKQFLRPEHLKSHTLTHIGQKTIECEYCSSTLSCKSSLYSHIRKKHPEKSLEIKITEPNNVQPSPEFLLEQAIQSLEMPPAEIDMATDVLPEEILENDNFSTVNLRDLE